MTTTTRPQRPAPGAPREYHFPRFERRTLANGMSLVVAPVPKLPIATVLAVIDAGAVSEPVGVEGVAQLTARLLLEGTTASDGDALARRFELLGASVDAYADWDATVVTLTALTDRLPAAMELLADVLRNPGFRDRDLERLKAERLADLLQLRAEPRGLADELFARFTYEAGSRFAKPDGGDDASVARLDGAAVRAFYDERYRAGGVTVVVAGDVTADGAEALVAKVLGGWSGAAPAPTSASAAPARASRAVHLVQKAEAAQSEVRVGHVGVPRAHADYFPLVVMNAILGGLFSSRININLRERHGYTYGAFSGFDWRRQAGPFVVSSAVQGESTAAAIAEILGEVERMRVSPVSNDELTLATSYLDGVFPIRYETTAAIAGALAAMVIHGLPADYFDAYRGRVRAVTAEDVQRVAAAHLAPDRAQVVVVGDPTLVRSQLDAAAFGPLTAYDAAGTPLA